MSDAEIAAFDAFQRTYERMHPYPDAKDSMPSLGWEFAAALATSASSVLLAAFRTGQAFYLAAANTGNPLFATLEAVAAVVAIEGSVVLFAVRRPYEKRKTSANSTMFGLVIAFIISALAGLYQSVNILSGDGADIIVMLLNWTLVVMMGLGATIIAWLGGDILGVQIVRLEEARTQANERFARAERSYRGRLLKAWKASNELNAVNERKRTRYKTRTNKPANERTNEQFKRSQRTVRSKRTNERREEIYSIMDRIFSDDGRVGGVSEIAEILARLETDDDGEVSELKNRYKGYVSQVRKDWLNEKGDI